MHHATRHAAPALLGAILSFLSLAAGCTANERTPPSARTTSADTAGAVTILGYGGKCLDANEGSAENGTVVQLWDCNGSTGQQWTLLGSRILGPGGKCLDASGVSSENGTTLQLWDCWGGPNQDWSFQGGQIVGIGGKCADAAGISSADGTRIILWDCWGGPNQQWQASASSGGGGDCGGIAVHTLNPDVGANVMMSPNDVLNQDIEGAPVDPASASMLAALGADNPGGHPAFGHGAWAGYVYTVVPPNEPRVPVVSTAYGVQPPGSYPIPLDAPVEPGDDAHVFAIQCDPSSANRLGDVFELWAAAPGNGVWMAGSGAFIDLRPSEVGPAGWTYGTNAAGIPKLPLLVRYEEIAAGEIRHALSFDAWTSAPGFVYPATSWAVINPTPEALPMGARLRLRADFDKSGWSPTNQIILTALQRYGMILTDNGTASDREIYLEGVGSDAWDDADLHNLKTNLRIGDFEVIAMGEIRH